MGSSLYQDVSSLSVQGIREVRKLSKQRASAADQAQMNTTSESVCASFPEVRQTPRGGPKYSSC